MKAFNAVQRKNKIDFIFEFIPQIVLLTVLFGFMDLLIVVKWLTNFEAMENARPPSVITAMINMCLGFGEQKDARTAETELLPHQPLIMKCCLITALICVPLMLYVKPIYEYMH